MQIELKGLRGHAEFNPTGRTCGVFIALDFIQLSSYIVV